MTLAQLYEKWNTYPLQTCFGLQETNNFPIKLPAHFNACQSDKYLEKSWSNLDCSALFWIYFYYFKEWHLLFYIDAITTSQRSKATFSVISTSKLNCVELECLDYNSLHL